MVEYGASFSVEDHVVCADPLIESRKPSECRPAPCIPEGLFNLRVDNKWRINIRKNRTPRIRHEAELLESSHTLEIEFRPGASPAPRGEALHPHAVDYPYRTVNPAEAESFLNGVEVIECVIFLRSPAFYIKPAFTAFPAVGIKPFSPLRAASAVRNADTFFLRQGRR